MLWNYAVPPAAPAFKATFKTSKPHHDGAHPQPELGLSLLVKNLLRISANCLIPKGSAYDRA
jgi:hypothetical protein